MSDIISDTGFGDLGDSPASQTIHPPSAQTDSASTIQSSEVATPSDGPMGIADAALEIVPEGIDEAEAMVYHEHLSENNIIELGHHNSPVSNNDEEQEEYHSQPDFESYNSMGSQWSSPGYYTLQIVHPPPGFSGPAHFLWGNQAYNANGSPLEQQSGLSSSIAESDPGAHF